MKIKLIGETSDQEDNFRVVRFEEDVELDFVPRRGERVIWQTRLRSQWRVDHVVWDTDNNTVQVNLR